jgi:hypothetical protein
MAVPREHDEVQRLLRTPSGQDFLPSLSLLTVHIESATILSLLRGWATASLPSVRQTLGREVCLLAFGSLGRLEFVRGQSDLDPIILVDDGSTSIDPNSIRSAVLTPLAKDNPWLLFDDRPKVVQGEWGSMGSVELRFPVLTIDQLLNSSDELIGQRRWQVLLEARPLYNEGLFRNVREQLIPGGEKRPDFIKLIETAPSFYAAFENPIFLYKSAAKYWKTRFLREFFVFSTQLSLLLGWYLDRDGEQVDDGYVRAATAVKIIRAIRFAQVLDKEGRYAPGLNRYYVETLEEILKDHDVDKSTFLPFGRDYDTEAGRLLHGLLMGLLVRFTQCWEKLYDPQVKAALDKIPKEATNFDATFRRKIADTDTASIVDELLRLRSRYKQYMAATSKAIESVFVRGRVWARDTIPRRAADALTAFRYEP